MTRRLIPHEYLVYVYISHITSHVTVYYRMLATPPSLFIMAANSQDIKGYDHEFVDPPPSDLLCLICLCVARNPQQVNCCGKVLCKVCLDEYKKSYSVCPQCRTSINSFADKRGK